MLPPLSAYNVRAGLFVFCVIDSWVAPLIGVFNGIGWPLWISAGALAASILAVLFLVRCPSCHRVVGPTAYAKSPRADQAFCPSCGWDLRTRPA